MPPRSCGESWGCQWVEGRLPIHTPPHSCRIMTPFFLVGSPHWLQVTFLPGNISRSETPFCTDQHGLGVTGRGAVSTSVLGLSILKCPSLQAGLDQLRRWGLLPGRLCPPLTFSRPGCVGDLASLPNPAPLRHSHSSRCRHEAVNVENELNWRLAWSTSADTPDTAGVHSLSRWAWHGTIPPPRCGLSPSSNNCSLF